MGEKKKIYFHYNDRKVTENRVLQSSVTLIVVVTVTDVENEQRPTDGLS